MADSAFGRVVGAARRIPAEQFVRTLGGIVDDIGDMVDGPTARREMRLIRDGMERALPLPDGTERLRSFAFGDVATAPELLRGEVAAIDGTPVLPVQQYRHGQAFGVAVGSRSYRQPLRRVLYYWSTQGCGTEDEAKSFADRPACFGSSLPSLTAFLRYFELAHGLELSEPYLFFDGPLVHDWLVTTEEGFDLYDDLFRSGKRCLGVIKSLKASPILARYAPVLQTGELYVVDVVGDDAERTTLWNGLGTMPRIARGVFKPGRKAFGFEAVVEHLDDVLRVLAGDCQTNQPGHEIPWLLNRVDAELRRAVNPRLLANRIDADLVARNAELFYEESDELRWR